MLDLQKLRTFQVVAESSSFTRAAAELGCSQSSVTTHVQALERELDAALFDRTCKRVVLTESGRRALAYANQILALAGEAKAAIHGDAELSGPFTVSAPEALMAYRLPEILREFQEKYPQVHVTLSTHANPAAQIEALMDAKLDLAFTVGETARSEKLTAKFLASEEIVIVGAPDLARDSGPELTADAMGERKILLTEKNCCFRQLFERVVQAARVELNNTLELASIEAIKHCALAGMGLAVVPRMAVVTELMHKRLVAFRWPRAGLRAQIQIQRHRKRPASPAANAFWMLAEKAFGKRIEAQGQA